MADGSDRSTVIRDAVRLAWRDRRRSELIVESEQIAADEADRAEIRSVQRDLESLRAW